MTNLYPVAVERNNVVALTRSISPATEKLTNAAITGGVDTSVAPSENFTADQVGLYVIVDTYTTDAELGVVASTSSVTPVGGGTFANNHLLGVGIKIVESAIYTSWFGMFPDNLAATNNTAFQAAVDAAKTAGAFASIPFGEYSLSASIYLGSPTNGSGLRGLMGNYSTLFFESSAGNCLDWTGDHFKFVSNIKIIGRASSPPAVGLLLARASTNAVGGLGVFDNVFFEGEFTTACVYNYASESNQWRRCHFVNDGGTSCFIGTFDNTGYSVTSTNTTIYGSGISNTIYGFYACRFVQTTSSGAGRSCLELDGCEDVLVDNACYFFGAGDHPLVRIVQNGSQNNRNIRLEGFYEFDSYSEAVQVEAVTSELFIRGHFDENRTNPNYNTDVLIDSGVNVTNVNIQCPYIKADGAAIRGYSKCQAEDYFSCTGTVEGDVWIKSTGTLSLPGGVGNRATVHYTDTGIVTQTNRQQFTFYRENIAASQSNLPVRLGENGTYLIPMPRAGSITGWAAMSNLTITGGNATFSITKNGVAISGPALTINSGSNIAQETFNLNTHQFAAGDYLGITLSSDSSWAPATADVTVCLEIST